MSRPAAHLAARRTARRWAWLLACLLASPAVGQLAPRVTGQAVLDQLASAQHDLAAHAQAGDLPSLAAASQQLARMAIDLHAALGDASAKPVALIDERTRARAWRAQAAAQRTRAYLQASPGCAGTDAAAMAAALSSTVERLATATDSSRDAQPVIDAVETLDHQPLFAMRPSAKPLAFALVGSNLADPQCADPKITATDDQGRPLAVQPVATGVSPARIELELPPSGLLAPGGYVVHVVPSRKAFLVGCTAQPEAIAVVQVARPLRIAVDYTLAARCGTADGVREVSLATGTLPDITAHGGMVQQQVDTTACGDPLSYTVSAGVTRDGGGRSLVGPIEQSANASITAGLPGGLSLNWNPSIHTLFVRSGAPTCKGVH